MRDVRAVLRIFGVAVRDVESTASPDVIAETIVLKTPLRQV